MGSTEQTPAKMKDPASAADKAEDSASAPAAADGSKMKATADTAKGKEEADKAESKATDEVAAGDSKEVNAPVGVDESGVSSSPDGDKPDGEGKSDKGDPADQSEGSSLNANAKEFDPFATPEDDGESWEGVKPKKGRQGPRESPGSGQGKGVAGKMKGDGISLGMTVSELLDKFRRAFPLNEGDRKFVEGNVQHLNWKHASGKPLKLCTHCSMWGHEQNSCLELERTLDGRVVERKGKGKGRIGRIEIPNPANLHSDHWQLAISFFILVNRLPPGVIHEGREEWCCAMRRRCERLLRGWKTS